MGYYVHGKVGDDAVLSTSVHMGKVAAVVSMSFGGSELGGVTGDKREKLLEVGKKLAMHTVAANPLYLDKENVPADVVEKETVILREQAMDTKAGGKPPPKPDLLAKIVAGKVSKRLGEITLLGQAHVAEEGQPVVGKFLADLSKSLGATVTVESFTKWGLGDGIAKQPQP